MIRGVTFDIGGTLSKGKLNEERFFKDAVKAISSLGYNVDVNAFKQALKKAKKKFKHLWLSGRETNFKEFYSLVLLDLGVKPEEELLKRLRNAYFDNLNMSALPGAKKVIQILSRNLKLGIISNSISGWPRIFLDREGITSYFDVISISCEIGWRKPHTKIFEVTLMKMGLKPWEVVHVGDDIICDVAGAKAMGMISVLVHKQSSILKFTNVRPDAIIVSLLELPRVLMEMDP